MESSQKLLPDLFRAYARLWTWISRLRLAPWFTGSERTRRSSTKLLQLCPDGRPALVHLRWVKYAHLLILKPRDGKELSEPRGVGISAKFQHVRPLEGSVDALAEQARKMGVDIEFGLLDQPWNVRELTILDPDGYQLVFTAPLHR